MHFDNKRIEQLLPGYCEGTLSKEDQELVREWIEHSEENRRIVKQIHLLNLAADIKAIREKTDTEKALANVSSRIHPARQRKRTIFTWIQRAAAVLFLPLLSVYIFQHISHTDTPSAHLVEIKTNPGMTTSVTLPDGSIVFLNSETTLSYPSQFSEGTREVNLEGEAFFQIEKDPHSKFIVSTLYQSKIEVFGTRFNVEAYKNNNFVSTTLVEGKVCFHYVKNDIAKSIILAPGEKLIHDNTTPDVKIVKTNGESEISWKDGKIIFANTPMAEALRMLEKRYNTRFIVANEQHLENSFTGTFTHQRLERILEYFKVSSRINWRYLESDDIRKEKSEIEIY